MKRRMWTKGKTRAEKQERERIFASLLVTHSWTPLLYVSPLVPKREWQACRPIVRHTWRQRTVRPHSPVPSSYERHATPPDRKNLSPPSFHTERKTRQIEAGIKTNEYFKIVFALMVSLLSLPTQSFATRQLRRNGNGIDTPTGVFSFLFLTASP